MELVSNLFAFRPQFVVDFCSNLIDHLVFVVSGIGGVFLYSIIDNIVKPKAETA